jgi:hypothetical protein
MHPIGISELRYLRHDQFRSAVVEYFVAKMQKLHDHIKRQLQDRSQKYKSRVDQKRREVHFKFGEKS